ncbi:hypothetical protein L1049_024069 [Liquidambar formosana]|uniref:Phytocyanin domain-containing protein n=1 Tax=Liquidambar formosana TaxID=63359 RepID=A0AAP0X480_LIQFO
MAMLRTFFSLAVSAMLIELAMAANYTVGGSNAGWDTSTDLKTWASSQSFLVGDNLIFQYSPNHDVVEVGKSDYDSCQASNPVQSYSSSPTTIPLSSPGKRYFICGTIGHCSQGMKVEVNTLAASSPSTPPPVSSVSPPAPSPPPETSAPQPTLSTPPPVSSVSPPASSPPPETSAPLPTLPPESAPTKSPSSPTKSPTASPTSSPRVPTTESRTNIPSIGSSPQPSPASAYRLVMGFGFVMMVLLAL